MLWIILRPRYWVLDRKVRSANRFIIIGVVVAIAVGGQWLYNHWIEPNFNLLRSEQTVAGMASFLPFGFFLLMLFALLGVGDITQQLYQSADTELLMTAPVPFRTIYVVKLLQASRATIIPGITFMILFLVLGLARAMTPVYYLLAVVLILSAMILVTAIVMLLVILLARLLPPQKLRSWMPMFLGGFTVLFALLQTPATQWLLNQPDLTSALVNFLFEIPMLWRLAVISAALAAAAAMLTFQVFNRSFHEGWNRYQQVPTQPTARPDDSTQQRHGVARWVQPLPQPLRSFVVKEWLFIRREPRGLLNLAQPLVLIAVIIAPFLANPAGTSALMPILFWFILIYLAFFLSLAPLGIPLQALMLEGREISLLRSAPVSMSDVLKGKFWATWPVIALSWVFVFLFVGILMDFSYWQTILLCGVILYGLGGTTAMTLAIGALHVDFTRDELRQRTPTLAGYLIMGLNLVFMLATLITVIFPMVRLFAGSSTTTAIRSLSAYPVIQWFFSEAIWPIVILLAIQLIFWIAVRYLWLAAVHRLERMEVN